MKFFRFICLATAFLLAVSLVWAGGRRDTGDMPQGIHLTWSTNDVYRTMTISWWTEGSTDSAVKYGTRSGTYASEATGIQHQIKTKASTWEHQYHDVELIGLEPGRTYYFVCGGKDGWSKEYKFKTIGLNQQVRFVFGGDSRGFNVKKETVGPLFPEARRVVSDRAAKEKPDFVLFAGDMVYRGYREDQWQAWLEDIPGRLIIDGPVPRIIPLVPVIGNHDCGYDQNIADMSDYDYYRGVFALPPVSGKNEHNELYYTLDFPGLHLVVLWTAGGRRDGRSYGERVEREVVEQTGWLEQELERLSTTGDWVVTAQHFCIVSGHGLQPGNNGWATIHHWVPLFEKYRVPLNLAGHSHHYVRTYPMTDLILPKGFVDFDRSGNQWPNGAPKYRLTPNSRDGVTYLVSGNWGAPIEWMEKDSSIRIYPWFAAAYARLSYVLIEVSDKGLHVATKAASYKGIRSQKSKIIDEFTLPYETESFPTAEYNVAF